MFSRCSCFNFVKHVTYNFSTSNLIFKNHYDSLGITPKATQNDIKSAYYKLSMMYHPDKNKGSVDASKKFQDISAAYEVLGNYKFRRLYDKGLLHTADQQFTHVEPEFTEDDDPHAGFYRSRHTRHTAPPPTGRTPIYDFDEWSRAHYGATFERANRARERYREKMAKIERDKIDVKTEMVIAALMTIVFLCLFYSYFTQTDYDDVSKSKGIKNTK